MPKTSKTQYKIITVLENSDEMTAYQIAKLIEISPRHTNRLLRELYREGRVSRRKVPHRPPAVFKRLYRTISRKVRNGKGAV